MFKLPNPPSPQAETHELADFVEFLSWDKGTSSIREVVAILGREDDNDNNIGCDDDDDENASLLDEVMNEIERRAEACGSSYPFDLELEGTVVRHNIELTDHRAELYRYLLLSTRLNMQTSRIHEGLDGGNLLEEVTAQVLRCYLGGGKARSIVFGTAKAGSFEDKVTYLCQELHEGGGFRSLDKGPVRANDDKLDAVAWVPFSDKLPGQLIMFAQCKTGTTWGGLVTQLQPDAFIKKWMSNPFLINPIRTFCIAEAANRSRWRGTCTEAGILIDRCRIVDFWDELEPDLLERIKCWTIAAKQSITFTI